jgi:hypothetical protein
MRRKTCLSLHIICDKIYTGPCECSLYTLNLGRCLEKRDHSLAEMRSMARVTQGVRLIELTNTTYFSILCLHIALVTRQHHFFLAL